MESFDKVVTTDLGEGSSQLAASNMVTILSTVNVANFVSSKLSGKNNYKLWKQQILCLIEANDLLPYIYSPHPEDGDRRTGRVVLGWILGSLADAVHKKVAHLTNARNVWMELDKKLNTGPDVPFIKSSPTILSIVNVANFISTKLSGSNNYPSWEMQISCLIEVNNLYLYISPDEDLPNTEDDDTRWKEKVVLGWILGSLDDAVLKTVLHCYTAKDVWAELKKNFGPAPAIITLATETEWDKYLPLVINIRKGEWEKAQKFIEEKMQDNISAAITSRSDTCLHLAMSYDVIPLVQFLVGRMDSYQLKNKNIIGNTALHTAAWSIRCSQTAIDILVDRVPYLMNFQNEEFENPCHLAVRALKKDLVKYFLSKMDNEWYFEWPQDTGAKLLCMLIEAEYYDVAKTVTDICPDFACLKLLDGTTALHKLVLKDTGKGRSNFSFWERFLHSIPPESRTVDEESAAVRAGESGVIGDEESGAVP
ncbi:Ankyrin repeat family protein [Striga hermonthica]|uniref:Ankyrin repeat family protein n=1 Tax=Striga hermonthica TaxID=68872 RepID=A0A9N7R4H5_STRHE|nr:Ankyrin repeat family protein [Striga hermonthica]